MRPALSGVTCIKLQPARADVSSLEENTVDFAQVALGNLVGIVGFVLLIAGVAKLFQLSTTLNEIKDLLVDIKRSAPLDHAPAHVPLPYSQSGDEMLRALSATHEPPVLPETKPLVP
jgi:hypothetical protein